MEKNTPQKIVMSFLLEQKKHQLFKQCLPNNLNLETVYFMIFLHGHSLCI